jgi:hypothetical protein
MRPENATLVDRFELIEFPVRDLPLPAVERYRMVPIQSLYLEIDFDDSDSGESSPGSDSGSSDAVPPSDRYMRARCWASEE